MKLPATTSLKLRNPNKETEPTDDAPAKGRAKPTPLEWTGGRSAATKILTWLLYAAIVAGPLGLIGVLLVGFTSSTPTQTNSTAVTAADASTRVAVGEFASDFVTTWLTSIDGSQNKLAPYFPNFDSVVLAKAPWPVSNPAVAAVTNPSPGVWSVTVAVTVKGQREFFQVPIAVAGSTYVAETLPAPVAGHVVAASAPSLNYPSQVATTTSIATTAQAFLAALLTGQGDVTRYITPGSSIAAISPAPFSAVQIENVQSDDQMAQSDEAPPNGRRHHLLVDATVTNANGLRLGVEYALTMTARAGRWEVTSINTAPLTNQPAAAAPATAAPSTSSTSSTN